MSKNKVVIGIVDSEAEAETLLQRLRQDGFSPSEISAIFPDKRGTRDFAHEHNTKAPEGAVVGVAGGGLVGGTLGLLAGIGALAIPGLGPFIAAGPLMAALSGAAAGATVGGVAGAEENRHHLFAHQSEHATGERGGADRAGGSREVAALRRDGCGHRDRCGRVR